MRAMAALAAASVLGAIGVATWWTLRPKEPALSLGFIEAVSGTERFKLGDALGAESVLNTDAGGRVAVRLASGPSLRIDTGTALEVLAEGSLRLQRGTVYVDAGPTSSARRSALTIATPRGVVRDVGTQFELRVAEESVRVRVREGAVTLTGDGGAVDVTAGQQVEVDERGRAERRSLAVFGDDWRWTEDLAPTLTIEGRPLRAFLDGIARERGLSLRFVSADLAAAAATVTLNGSIAGMTLDEALVSVLPTCRMRHRIEGGLLVIEPLEPTDDAH